MALQRNPPDIRTRIIEADNKGDKDGKLNKADITIFSKKLNK